MRLNPHFNEPRRAPPASVRGGGGWRTFCRPDKPYRLGAVALLCLGAQLPAQAIFAYASSTQTVGQITLRVGTPTAGSVDNVVFTVPGNVVGNGTAVVGSPSILVVMTLIKPVSLGGTYTLSVNSSAGMACQSTSCSGTTIPFSTVSWTSTVLDTTFVGWDIPSGTFNNGASQSLRSMGYSYAPGTPFTFTITNTLAFSYANTTVYPSGIYRGRVTYTATSI